MDISSHHLLRNVDWNRSPLGTPNRWPAAFRIALSLILQSPEAMYIAWGTERLFFFNDAYARLLGDKLDGAMGAPMHVVWADVWQDVRHAIDATFAGGSERFEDLPLSMNRDGEMRETFWTFAFSPLRDEHGDIVGLFCVTSEQTQRIQVEEAHQARAIEMMAMIAQGHGDLVKAEGQLRQSQKLEAIGQLTGGVAHDFNNLLTVIRGSVDLLRREDLSPERRTRYIDAIGETADRAAALTGQLLAFARRQALKPEEFDAGASIAQGANIVRTLTGSRIAVDIQLPEQQVFVLADRSQLDTAIVNMAINARDAMNGEGRLTITAEPVSGIPKIRSHDAVAGEFVAITVADTGSGIAPDQIGRIFEPFFTTKVVGQGTGLGLSQVFGFAKQSGGDIRVESEPGKGTSFTLYLPRAYPETADDAAETPEQVDGDGVCVLVVEDNVSVGEFATEALKELGYDSVLAINADEALAELNKDCSRFHIVFSDVVMPGMSGLDLGARIRRDYPDVPVILASGYSHVLAENGKHGFELLHKPYSIEELSRVLRKTIAWQARRGKA
ncbi:ATP-binding protein [Sphingomonas rubra]|uniref:histidine kinase n=1 Tax=Sphingomonas rubra TaxID=634430 RepID=A0A1I5TCC7_9SPHN|nr:ATP-binding protein [Sphingomonas rubra]SFP80695.1 PAS fold-containing protein [Sphingomonas rubra]